MKTRFIKIIFLFFLFIIVNIIISNEFIKYKRYNIRSSKIEKPIKIIQISDYHNKNFKFNNLIRKIKVESPDIIVITGDFLDSRNPDYKLANKTLAKLKNICQEIIFIPGNHEARLNYNEIKENIKKLDIKFIDDNVAYKYNNNINIFGVKDIISFNEKTEFYNTLNNINIDKDKYNILLIHRPDFFNSYKKKYDLILAGHTHGGQIRLPFIGGIFAPGQGFFPRFISGLYKDENSNMIISKGLGSSSIKCRFFNRPELTVINLNIK